MRRLGTARERLVWAVVVGWLSWLGLLVAPVAAASVPTGACEHVVESGDTLSAIAASHGLSRAALVRLNPALREAPDRLRLGQRLKVCSGEEKRSHEGSAASRSASAGAEAPSTRPLAKCPQGEAVPHTVRSRETLSAIALKYGVTEKSLLSSNPTLRGRPDQLRVDQVLSICTGRPPGTSKLCGHESALFRHEVVPGEHLGQIAGRYGVRRRDLMRWNPGLADDPDKLRVGQRVVVCPEISPRERSRIEYVVKSGETLASIAKRYDLTPRELERFQEGALADRNQLREGQKLFVWVDGEIVAGWKGADAEDRGTLPHGTQLPRSPHYLLKWDEGAWGTTTTIEAIQRALRHYRKRRPGGPRVQIGDISRRVGGVFPPHKSHQKGKDVDVGYVLRGAAPKDGKFTRATAANLDVGRSWELVKSFIETDEVVYVFMDYKLQELLYEYAKARGMDEDSLDELFQYPRREGRTYGIIRHEKGHSDHFHVRFRR